jgi:hypothetical protein
MKTTNGKPGGKFLPAFLTLLLALPLASLAFIASARANSAQDQGNENGRVLHLPQGQRHRRVRGDRPRRGRHSIRRSFARAGRSAGRGGKRFGQNIGHGRPVRGGKELGKGMGGFGKHTGRGIGRTMRRVFKP